MLPEQPHFETEARVAAEVSQAGFAFLHGAALRPFLEASGPLSDWPALAASFDHLALDTYMADGGRYRRRRHAVLTCDAGSDQPVPAPRRPHYQALDYNPLNGGVERWYEPVEPSLLAGPSLRAVLSFGARFFRRLRPGAAWTIELHQFRIEASAAAKGLPTPEGLHRDGVDCVLVALVRRVNVRSGTTSVHAGLGPERGALLGSFTLTDPLDAALVDDARVLHGVTAVEPVDPALPACRDVLVATYLRA
jgi:hypothetical protein